MLEHLPPSGGTVWEGGGARVVEPCWRKLLVTKVTLVEFIPSLAIQSVCGWRM